MSTYIFSVYSTNFILDLSWMKAVKIPNLNKNPSKHVF